MKIHVNLHEWKGSITGWTKLNYIDGGLEDYGFYISDSVKNYIDFENKKFIQKVGKIVIDNNTPYSWIPALIDRCTIRPTPLAKNGAGIGILYLSDNTNIYSVQGEASGGLYIIFNEAYSSVNDLKASLIGTIIYYELATPIETDISSYIDDTYIDVKPNGTLTFNNTYEQDVPSEITYLIEEVKA